jgi:hypothetical protein
MMSRTSAVLGVISFIVAILGIGFCAGALWELHHLPAAHGAVPTSTPRAWVCVGVQVRQYAMPSFACGWVAETPTPAP